MVNIVYYSWFERIFLGLPDYVLYLALAGVGLVVVGIIALLIFACVKCCCSQVKAKEPKKNLDMGFGDMRSHESE